MFSSTKCCCCCLTIVNYDFASIHFPSLILSLGTSFVSRRNLKLFDREREWKKKKKKIIFGNIVK